MRKQRLKKLTLHRETVRHLSTELLKKAQAGGQRAVGSGVQECDTACTASTLSCTQ